MFAHIKTNIYFLTDYSKVEVSFLIFYLTFDFKSGKQKFEIWCARISFS